MTEESKASAEPVPPPEPQADGAPGPTATVDTAAIEKEIIARIKTVYDPEIPVDIWEMGLIYSIEVSPAGEAKVQMTLTAPACPSAEELPSMVETRVASVPGVTKAKVEVVWDPPWDKDRMSEAAKLRLGFL
jgi:FeS assembly SUF system protein